MCICFANIAGDDDGDDEDRDDHVLIQLAQFHGRVPDDKPHAARSFPVLVSLRFFFFRVLCSWGSLSAGGEIRFKQC